VDTQKSNIIIIGAGPAGAACALSLSKSGHKVLILEKEVFPRDKICGDALSADVINQLPLLSEELLSDFLASPSILSSRGVKVVSPKGEILEVPYDIRGKQKNGFLCKRIDFDYLLYKQLKKSPNISIIQDCKVIDIDQHSDCVVVNTSKGVFKSDIIVGADGCKSIVARKLGNIKLDHKHYIAGLRVYYEGVANFHKENYIEIYLFKELLPGYLWVFPLPDNKANVGLGMVTSELLKKNVKLKETLFRLISTHPELKERFKNATPLESVKGHGLPIGSKKRSISGERFLLVGDAAGLIDPISGEGVGNSIRSGRIAAEHLKECMAQNNYSASFNKKYDTEIYRRMWPELRISKQLQAVFRYNSLLNMIIHKGIRSVRFLVFMVEALHDFKSRNILTFPSFYFRLLFSSKK
jgi:geranylgeranyl reductase family protein